MSMILQPITARLLGAAVPFRSTVREFKGNKHWLIKWRELRRKKFVKIELPDYDLMRKEMHGHLTPSEVRAKFKKEGMAPTRPYNERPILIQTTETIFEPFLPPEGDGRLSTLSKEGAKQRFEEAGKKTRSMWHLRKLRRYDEEFDSGDFAGKAQDLYIDAHHKLAEGKLDELHDLVTESGFSDMVDGMENKTVRWKWHETLELPRIMHIRVAPVIDKTNLFAQITVRIHGRQSLGIYDRFGRLMYGSQNLVKNVLEYVVFEKHVSDPYGTWRIHSKIVPSWAPPRDPILRTFRKPELIAPSESYLEKEKKKQEIEDIKDDDDPKHASESTAASEGKLATA
ncbi:probable 39S ribosomal protein L45, mitochondrial [Paramacrobiotus metropolitanus]|uniref:probable 39S ribosomal protein L45, mitochondrial n=1 Tax=Paramacrobiotus metropolitanus TaxID=2943436 RepID=UPI0024461FA2|nr:probable 39S ribosomal protein L45, mitochondrial [Paramacrobiotus metropolitanus]